MFFDLALTYDKDARSCDLALGDDCDLAVDTTSLPAVLMSVGLDRRAAPDDELPEGRSQMLAPISFSERRGCPGDGLDPFGDLTGSRLWLLDRAKQSEQTRQMTEFWLAECLAWAQPETGIAPEIEVQWLQRNVLGYRVMVVDGSVSLSRRIGD